MAVKRKDGGGRRGGWHEGLTRLTLPAKCNACSLVAKSTVPSNIVMFLQALIVFPCFVNKHRLVCHFTKQWHLPQNGNEFVCLYLLCSLFTTASSIRTESNCFVCFSSFANTMKIRETNASMLTHARLLSKPNNLRHSRV